MLFQLFIIICILLLIIVMIIIICQYFGINVIWFLQFCVGIHYLYLTIDNCYVTLYAKFFVVFYSLLWLEEAYKDIFTKHYFCSLVYSSVNLCFLYFCGFLKKGLRPKWTIYQHESHKSIKCLSVGYFGIIFAVVIVCCL